jgi:hypothetical protein
MAELLRAKADGLEGELAPLRSLPWWRRLARRKKPPSGNFDVPRIYTNLQAGFTASEVA